MTPEDVNTTTRTRQSEADSASPGAKSLLHSLLGLAENSKGRVRGQVAVPPVSFRYGADAAAIMAQPGVTSPAPPEMTLPPRQDMARQAPVDPTGSQNAPQTRSIQNGPDNDNRQVPAQENNRQVADKESRGQQPSGQQPSTRETANKAAPPPAASPAGVQERPGERRIPQETGNAAPAKPAMQHNVMPQVPAQENNRGAAAKESRPQQQGRQQRSSKETVPEAAPPPAAAMVHRQTTETKPRQTTDENFSKEQGPAAQAADQQAVAQAAPQTVSHREEITVPGFSPQKSHFPLLSALMDEAPAAAEKPAAGLTADHAGRPKPAFTGLQAQEHFLQPHAAANNSAPDRAGQKDAVFTRHLQQALSADKREKNSSKAPGSDNQPALQEQQGPVPPAGKDIVPPVVAGHRLTQKHGTVAPVPGADDGEVFQRLEQLGQSFHQLLAKKSADYRQKDDPPPRQEAAKDSQKPAMRHVVVIQKNIAGPAQERTAAFWERSYLGRSRLTIIR